MTKERWEYRTAQVAVDPWATTALADRFGEVSAGLGSEGWEMVGSEAIIRPGWIGFGAKTVGIIGFFKRPLPVPAGAAGS